MSSPTLSPGGAYRPPQWSKPAMVAVTVMPYGTGGDVVTDNAAAGRYTLSTSSVGAITYVFDAVLDLDHQQTLEKTQHPVQTGANISSHAYLMPARVALSVGMSDAMAAYYTGAANAVATGANIVSPFTGNPSKSVSAYQNMLALQKSRQLLQITTRLRTYTNMVITSISPRETSATIAGLRMRVEFEEIFVATTAVVPASARSNTTDNTGLGIVTPSPVPNSTQSQYGVGSTAPDVNVPGAGVYSSYPSGAAQ